MSEDSELGLGVGVAARPGDPGDPVTVTVDGRETPATAGRAVAFGVALGCGVDAGVALSTTLCTPPVDGSEAASGEEPCAAVIANIPLVPMATAAAASTNAAAPNGLRRAAR